MNLTKNGDLMTDEQLMEAIKSGDLQQASWLFERYHRRIYSFLARLSGDRVLAEDLTQNVFLRIIRYRSSYRTGLKFQSWIFQVARNVFADHYQEEKRRKINHIDVERIGDITAPEGGKHASEQDALLQQSLERLDAEQRELLVLTRFEKMKYEDVATIMNTTVANIKVKVHRAIGALRQQYFELEKQ